MGCTKNLFKFAFILLYVWMVQGIPTEHKGDQIRATFAANVAHVSLVNEEHNASSAINGSVNALVSTIKGCSLEQLFQRIGEVLSRMVANAGGSIVPSIHDDTGRNRVEFIINVTAEQHNNVSSLQAKPKGEHTPGTQREVTGENYYASLDDNSEINSPATIRRPHQKPANKNSSFQLTPVDQNGNNWSEFKKESSGSSRGALGNHRTDFNSQPKENQYPVYGRTQLVESDEEEQVSEPPNQSEPFSHQPSVNDLSPQHGISPELRVYPKIDSKTYTNFEEDQSTEEDSKMYLQHDNDNYRQPKEGPEKAYPRVESDQHEMYAEIPEEKSPWRSNHNLQNGTVFELDDEVLETDSTPIMPYSDLPHVHNGNNYAEILTEELPTPGSLVYPSNSDGQFDQPNTYVRALTEEPQTILNRGSHPSRHQSEDIPKRHFETHSRYIERPNLNTQKTVPREDPRRMAYRPARYPMTTKDTILARSSALSQFNPGDSFIPGSGVRPQQIVKQTLDNSQVLTSQGIPSGDSGMYFEDAPLSLPAFTTIDGSQLHYFDKTPAFVEDTERASSPRGETSDSPYNPADFDNTFKQDLTDVVNDIGSTYKDGISNNAFISPAEEEPYFPEVGETRYNTAYPAKMV